MDSQYCRCLPYREPGPLLQLQEWRRGARASQVRHLRTFDCGLQARKPFFPFDRSTGLALRHGRSSRRRRLPRDSSGTAQCSVRNGCCPRVCRRYIGPVGAAGHSYWPWCLRSGRLPGWHPFDLSSRSNQRIQLERPQCPPHSIPVRTPSAQRATVPVLVGRNLDSESAIQSAQSTGFRCHRRVRSNGRLEDRQQEVHHRDVSQPHSDSGSIMIRRPNDCHSGTRMSCSRPHDASSLATAPHSLYGGGVVESPIAHISLDAPCRFDRSHQNRGGVMPVRWFVH
jgi:hypothetical protein